MKKFSVYLLIGLLCASFAIGCASIIHGTTQEIQVNSSPDGAEIWVDGANMGKTPTRLTLSRKKEYLIKFIKEGHKEATVKIDGKISAWIIGNIIFGGIIGCGIDFITGGAYDLSPERLDVNLSKATAINGGTIRIPYDISEIDEIRFIDDFGKPELVLTLE